MTQNDKHGFKQTLNGIEGQTLFDANREQLSPKEMKAIRTALRLADRLQSGEVGDAVMKAGWEQIYPSDRATPNMVFKAMAQQLLKEIEND